ncbi:hypothetical protein A3Q56_08149 [Intoshia linei]|uniref:Uncharacterized protein n=1 Tax=Intoshia linei TaxID=1819745 RepID=A0A177AQR1_9BILA|nr:hypothetical protein A3Q56_08149 [Intoshia linei]
MSIFGHSLTIILQVTSPLMSNIMSKLIKYLINSQKKKQIFPEKLNCLYENRRVSSLNKEMKHQVMFQSGKRSANE